MCCPLPQCVHRLVCLCFLCLLHYGHCAGTGYRVVFWISSPLWDYQALPLPSGPTVAPELALFYESLSLLFPVAAQHPVVSQIPMSSRHGSFWPPLCRSHCWLPGYIKPWCIACWRAGFYNWTVPSQKSHCVRLVRRCQVSPWWWNRPGYLLLRPEWLEIMASHRRSWNLKGLGVGVGWLPLQRLAFGHCCHHVVFANDYWTTQLGAHFIT